VSPTGEIVEAAALVADEPMLIRLGALARQREDLRDHVIGALDESAHPAARVILRRLHTDP
jgi:hypothetical protein